MGSGAALDASGGAWSSSGGSGAQAVPARSARGARSLRRARAPRASKRRALTRSPAPGARSAYQPPALALDPGAAFADVAAAADDPAGFAPAESFLSSHARTDNA